ncbi:MAG: retroviral-like aspartic protease family protein [Phycisphaerae bacterium]
MVAKSKSTARRATAGNAEQGGRARKKGTAKMGTFYVECEISSHLDRAKVVRIDKVLVDTGSEYTWVAEDVLRRLGIAAEKKDLVFQMANGQTITRRVGFAVIRAAGVHTTDEVVFAQPGDLQLLGARTLEGLNLRVDSRAKKLVAGGPLPAANAVKLERDESRG